MFYNFHTTNSTFVDKTKMRCRIKNYSFALFQIVSDTKYHISVASRASWKSLKRIYTTMHVYYRDL